jgi:C-terminal processing protease CtpA/Prc
MSKPYFQTTATLLMKSRDSIDARLAEVKAYLESTGLGYRSPLVDRDGYPLPNIDHTRILTERQQAARLLNDRKRIEVIADVLSRATPVPTLGDELERLRPFAIVDEVFANSPAEAAGVQNGDFLLRFGSATQSRLVPTQIMEGNPVVLNLLRVEHSGWNVIDITVIPAKWSGSGLIGAHLQPYLE